MVLILDFEENVAVLWDRLHGRSREGKDSPDADIAVLKQQMKEYQPLNAEKKEFALLIDTEKVSAGESAGMVKIRLTLE